MGIVLVKSMGVGAFTFMVAEIDGAFLGGIAAILSTFFTFVLGMMALRKGQRDILAAVAEQERTAGIVRAALENAAEVIRADLRADAALIRKNLKADAAIVRSDLVTDAAAVKAAVDEDPSSAARP